MCSFTGGKYGQWVELLELLVVRGARNVFIAVCKKAMTNQSLHRLVVNNLWYLQIISQLKPITKK